MNWDAIGAIGEILGAIAVLGTLIYLAAQIRQNTAAVTTATYESMVSGITDVNLVVVGNPEVTSILNRGARDPHSLDDDEAYRYTTLMRCWANQWLKQLRLFEEGALGLRDWKRLAQEAAQALSSPGGTMFRERNHVFDDLYVEIDKYERIQISDFAVGRRSENDAYHLDSL